VSARRAVLGIDAAWTLTQSSGLALAVERQGRWRLIAADHSYACFHARAHGSARPDGRPAGSQPDAAALLASAQAMAGCAVDLVAIDMPLAHSPIAGRRASDLAVSRAYASRKCATHSPSAQRPGALSDRLKQEFDAADYSLCTTTITTPGVIEVYPHPALLALSGAAQRLPYKFGKRSKYWPTATRIERRDNVLAQWAAIVQLLDAHINGVAAALPAPGPDPRGWELKAYEDTLDAVICAWIAVCCLEDRACAYGDRDSAIWIPALA
jgi:predicted RNase H-like nuclease